MFEEMGESWEGRGVGKVTHVYVHGGGGGVGGGIGYEEHGEGVGKGQRTVGVGVGGGLVDVWVGWWHLGGLGGLEGFCK